VLGELALEEAPLIGGLLRIGIARRLERLERVAGVAQRRPQPGDVEPRRPEVAPRLARLPRLIARERSSRGRE